MANVRVAVRVRPLSKRETKEGGRIIVEVDGKVAKIRNLKVDSRLDGFGDSREKVVAFGFDYCYWSVNPEDPHYASQDVVDDLVLLPPETDIIRGSTKQDKYLEAKQQQYQRVFQDLGTEVLSGAAKGYNICLFAYGQTGSGKTYTMLGTPASVGLTPRICEGLFIREEDHVPSSCRIKVSFLEIYNERVRDLLKQSDPKRSYTLRVREHPEMGPYVQGLSQHIVTNYNQVIQLLEEGIANRITAATHVHEASSRSHAIFTIHYTQAILENNFPSEIASKINLVDLAGSERADPSYCKDRITEGANINKSLVTLGIVISTLAQNSQVFSSYQSLNSTGSDGGDSGIRSSPSRTSSGGMPSRRCSYIPYRDSVLTWLLKDSLGGNSRTIMVATVSPAHTSYSETMSTLRYASNAKNIINKPQVNEDANIKLIRELREEIRRLKAMLLSFELRNFDLLSEDKDENLKELVLQNELKVDQLTKDWTRKWNEWKALLEHYRVDINRRRAGVVIDSSLPHLMALEEDVLSTGVVLYHLKNLVSVKLHLRTKKEGTTKIGRIDSEQEQDIVLQGQWIERDHCTITSACGVVVLQPARGARCIVNGREVTASCRLTQGAVITLGKAQKFRFNHPAEAAALRQRRQAGEAVSGSGSLEWLDLDSNAAAGRLGLYPSLRKERKVLEEESDQDRRLPKVGDLFPRTQVQQPQCSGGDLRPRILAGQVRAEQDLELDRTCVGPTIEDNQQWLLREETWPASLQWQQQQDRVAEKELEASGPTSAWLHTEPETQPCPPVQSQKRVVQPQLLRRRALRAAERRVQRRKISSKLERIIRKQSLLEAGKRLEQLQTSCWLQDDHTQGPQQQVQDPHSMAPETQSSSKSTSCSYLSLRRLCSHYLHQLHSVYLNWSPSTTLPPMPHPDHQISEKTSSEERLPQAAFYPPRHFSKNALCSSGEERPCTVRGASAAVTCLTESSESASILEMERVGKQPHRMVSQSSAFLDQPTDKLKARDEPDLTPSTQTRRAKGLIDSDRVSAGWQKERPPGSHKTAKGTGCSSSHPAGHKQAPRHGRTAKTFRTNPKPPSLSRTSKRQQMVQAVQVRGIAKMSPCLPHSMPLKRRHSTKDPDTTISLADFSSVVDHAREKDSDLSDADSSYSADSLAYVCAKGLTEPLKPEGPQGKKQEDQDPEAENTESDNSQFSEDSLAERRYQSPQDCPRNSYLTNPHSYPKVRARASLRDFFTSSESGLLIQAHRSFSLDSLIDAEEELRDQQEESVSGPSDEMPTETFWRQQSPGLPVVDQEAIGRCGPISHRAGTQIDVPPPRNSSFYLEPQSCCEQPESEVEENSQQADSLQAMPFSRGSPLVSMDSWFSCDSKINPSSPAETVGSLCPSPTMQEFQCCSWERHGYWLNVEELKPSGAEMLLPPSAKPPQGRVELPPCVRGLYTVSVPDMSKLSLCRSHSLIQPGAEGPFQARDTHDVAPQDISEASNNSSVLSVLAASATSFTQVGGAHERDWAVLHQKYLLELSHPVLEEEDASSLTQTSSKGEDTLLPGIVNSVDFNSPLQLSKIRRLRAEKEQDNLSVELESTIDFFTTSEKEMSYYGNYSADIESLTSGTTSAHFVTEKVANSRTEKGEVKKNLEECSQGSRKPEPVTSDECFSLKNSCYGNVTIAPEDGHWPQDWAPLSKNSVSQPRPVSHNSHQPPKEEKEDDQECSSEAVEGHTDVAFGPPSGPELYLHAAPWNPYPSSLQPPPLETFYVTKSRDALTETALEIPACREARVSSPPPQEAWGFGHDCQLQNAYLKNSFSALSQNQNPRRPSSQQVTAEGPVDPKANDVSREMGRCSGNVQESHNSIYCFVAQDRHFVPSTSSKMCEFEHQGGTLTTSLPAFKEGEKATIQSPCCSSSDCHESRKPLFLCESREEQEPNAMLRHTQAFDTDKHYPSGTSSDLSKSINVDHDKLGEMTASLKSRPVHHRVRSPEIMAQGESPAHKDKGKHETGLLGKAVHAKGDSEEFRLPETESTCEQFLSVACSQERNPSDYKDPGKSQGICSPKEEPSRKKQNNVSNGDEMAKLIRSVARLENDILEIESMQNMQLGASHPSGVSKEFQDQEMADLVLTAGSSRNHLSFRDQPSSPKQTDGVTFRASNAGEMEVNSTENDSQVQKITLNPIKSRECVQDTELVSEYPHSAVVARPTRESCDCSGTCAASRESCNASLKPRRTRPLAQALPPPPWPERSSEKEGEFLNASESQKGQPYGLGSPEELEMEEGIWESQTSEYLSSSEQEEPPVQGRVEMTVQRGGSPWEGRFSSTQSLDSQSQHGLGTPSSLETDSWSGRPDSPTAPPHQAPSSALPMSSPGLPGSYLHDPDAASISSVDCLLDPTILKTPNSPLVTRHQAQSGETGGLGVQGEVREGPSVAHSACCESAISTTMPSHSQSDVPENTPWGAVGWVSAHASPEAQGANLRSSSMEPGVCSASEAEAAAQREIKRISTPPGVSNQLEKGINYSSEVGNQPPQKKEVRQKAEKETKDLGPTSSAFSTPMSPLSVTSPEPSSHMCTGPTMLDETRWTKTREKQFQDSVAGGTVLPYYETLLEPDCSSEAPGRLHSQQVSQSEPHRARDECDAEEFHVTSLPAEPGGLLADDRKVLQVTPLSADSFQPPPNTAVDTGPCHLSRASSHTAPAPGESHYPGEPEPFLGAGEPFTCRCSSSEIKGQNRTASRMPSPANPLGSDSLPSLAVEEEDRKAMPEKAVAAGFSQAPSDEPVVMPHGRSPLALWDTAGARPSGGQVSNPAYQEPRTLETTHGRCSPGSFSGVAQEGKTTCFESSLVMHEEISVSLSGPNQDQVQRLEAPANLEEGKASPKPGTVPPGVLRRMELEAPSPPCVKWKGSVGSGLADAYSAGTGHPRSTPLLDPGPRPGPGGLRDEAPCRCPGGSPVCLACSGRTLSEGSRTLSPSRGQEEGRTLPCQQAGDPQPIAAHACPSPFSTLLYCGDPGKGISRAPPYTSHPSCVTPCRACGVDESGESWSREPDVLAHGIEPKDLTVECGPSDSSILESSASASVPSQDQSYSSLFTSGMRTSSLSYSIAGGSSSSVAGPEKRVSEMKVNAKFEAAPLPAGRSFEPLRKFEDSSLGGRNRQVSHAEPKLPEVTGRPHTPSSSEESLVSELVVEPYCGYLGNAVKYLLERSQLSTKSRDLSGLERQTKFVEQLKCIPGPRANSPWEEEEQQRDQTSVSASQDRSPSPSDESDKNDFSSSQTGGVDGRKAAPAEPSVTKSFSSGTEVLASVPSEQSRGPQPAAQSPGWPSGREHRRSLPVIAISTDPKYLRSSPRSYFSVISTSRSLQELNLSVEPPSPTDEDVHKPERLWPPHPRDCCSGKSAVRTPLKAEGYSLKTSSTMDSRSANHRPLRPASPPYPTSSTVSCMPVPDFMTPVPLKQVQQGKSERLGDGAGPEQRLSKVEKGRLHFGSSDINPYALHGRPEAPVRIGWKQYVFGSAVDVSSNQMPQGAAPPKVARCSSMDQGLEEQNSPFHSHLSSYANTRGLSSTCSSIENARSPHESWEVWGSSLASGNSCILAGPRGTAPPKGPDKKVQFLHPPSGTDSLGSEPRLAEESTAGPVDEIVLLYPSEVGSHMGQAPANTLEQGTQTLGCRPLESCNDVSTQLEAAEVPAPELASWTSMRNLSVHLSQLLHSTSELLGSLSQPSVTEKEPNSQRETPEEAPPTLMMDSCTQTTVDEGIQTNLVPPPRHPLTTEADPQQVNVALKALGSAVSSPSWQEKECVPETLKKREAQKTVWKMAGPPDLQKASPHCRSQSPPVSLSHLRFQKVPVGQNIPSLSPQPSPNASLLPSTQPEEPSHLAVSGPHADVPRSPGLCPSNAEPPTEPKIQKEQGPVSTLLVDRASSPILTLIASTQRTELPPSSLSTSPPFTHALEGFQKLVSNPDLPLDAPRPAVGDYYQPINESGGSQRVEALHEEDDNSPLERSDSRPFLEVSSPDSLDQSPKPQVHFLNQFPEQLQSRTTTWVQSRLRPRSKSQRLTDGFVPEDPASLEGAPLNSRGPSRRPSRTENGSETSPVLLPRTLNPSSSWGGPQHLSPCPVSELTNTAGLQAPTLEPTEACQSEGLLRPSLQACMTPEHQHHSLRDLPVHNKFSNWCGVQDDSSGGLSVRELLGDRCDLNSREQGRQRPPQLPDSQSLDPEWARRETIPLQAGAQSFSLSTELTEAKLHHGFGEADALLQVLQSGAGEALAADKPVLSTSEERPARRQQTLEALRRERAERLQDFRRTRSLSPQKQLSPLPDRDLPTGELDLPSRRREYLQQLRRDVVETTRNLGSSSGSSRLPSDIELMLQDYQRAREEAKVEIAQARARLRERTEQEKLRIRQQIVSQLLREEEKLHTLATSGSICASSDGSLSSGLTSGYNSSPALPGPLPSPDNVGDTHLPDSKDPWIGDVRGRSAVRTSHLSLAGSARKNLAYSSRASLGSCCCSPTSLSSLGTSYSSSYRDLAKHIVDISMADVMAACSDNLHNLFSRQAAAGWSYQGEEQEVQLYYKVFSSTRHGFLGAGTVSQPLSHVWAAVSDPTLWPLYHKPIQTARLHQRVTNSINLVYLVCDTSLCALKQPRDFCCVCVEAKEFTPCQEDSPLYPQGHLSIMAAQSVYDTSMPRPSRDMVRGEILPSAWILQPLTMEGTEVTRVIYLAQVELGAPGFPHQLLSSFIKQQPLIIAKLASFLGS